VDHPARATDRGAPQRYHRAQRVTQQARDLPTLSATEGVASIKATAHLNHFAYHNMDIVPHGPMPSKPCPRSKYVPGRHAFTALARALDTSSATTHADMQIVEVAHGSRDRRRKCWGTRRRGNSARHFHLIGPGRPTLRAFCCARSRYQSSSLLRSSPVSCSPP
jgi:hypothetical protein